MVVNNELLSSCYVLRLVICGITLVEIIMFFAMVFYEQINSSVDGCVIILFWEFI